MGSVSESGTMPESTDACEVWLAGNVRPVAGLAAIALATAAAVGVAVAMAEPPRWVVVAILAPVCLIAVAVVALGRAAALPRLVRRGTAVELRLAPGRTEAVPLGIVECVFRGSEPLAGSEAEPRFRVGTLVIRFAERATEFRARTTFRPWGSWEDGHAVIDGRWCEPLTPETVRRIAGRLVEAKREATGLEAQGAVP